MTLPNDISRCEGWPPIRETVRPCAMCQGCMRWQSVGTGGERTPYMVVPAYDEDGAVKCDQRISQG